jgi:hypothetical protein
MMKYLGIARNQNGRVLMPDTFEAKDGVEYEVVEIGGDIVLMPSDQRKARLDYIKELTEDAIRRHRKTLEKLA